MTTKTGGRLQERLAGNDFLITAEFVAGADVNADALKTELAALPRPFDAIVAAGGDISPFAAASLLANAGVEPVLGLLTRDRNRIALLSDVRGAAAMGINNVLCLVGDHQSLGETPEAAGTFDVDPTQLVQMLSANGSTVFVGAEAYPALRPLPLSLLDLRKKVAAGARFVITRPVADIAVFSEWLEAVRALGLHGQVAIIVGVQPGEASAQTIEQIRRTEGVRGVHVYWGGSLGAAAAAVKQSGL